MDSIQEYLPWLVVFTGGSVLSVATALVFKLMVAKLPGIAKGELLKFFAFIKSSAFIRPGAHCLEKRKAWVLATLELLECELPDPGEGREFYIDAGTATARRLGRWVPFLRGTGQKWAEVYREIGDELDPAFDKAIVERGGNPET